MKNGWQMKTLGEVCSKCENIQWKNQPATTQHKYIDLSSDRSTGQITDTSIITGLTAPSRAKQIVQTDDVLFATTRPTLRRVCRVPSSFNGEICSTGFCVLRPLKELTLSKWVEYNVQADSFYTFIEPLQTGANYPAVSNKDVRAYPIPIPPLEEQKRIVAILDSKFAAIDAIQNNAMESLEQAEALWQATLSQELSSKKGWISKTLGEVCEILTGTTPSTGEKSYWDGDIPWITPAEVSGNGESINDSVRHITPMAVSKCSLRLNPKGTVIFSSRAPIGKVAVAGTDLYCNQGFKNFWCNKDLYNYFLKYYLRCGVFFDRQEAKLA